MGPVRDEVIMGSNTSQKLRVSKMWGPEACSSRGNLLHKMNSLVRLLGDADRAVMLLPSSRSLTRRWNGSLRIRSSVDFWYFPARLLVCQKHWGPICQKTSEKTPGLSPPSYNSEASVRFPKARRGQLSFRAHGVT